VKRKIFSDLRKLVGLPARCLVAWTNLATSVAATAAAVVIVVVVVIVIAVVTATAVI